MAGKLIKNMQISTVMVSPLRRALYSAYYLMKEHDDYESIRFLVNAKLREHYFGISESVFDIESQLHSLTLPNLDISGMLDQNGEIDKFFYIRNFQKEIRIELEKCKTHEEIQDILREVVLERYPESPEDIDGTYERVQEMKDYIRMYLNKNQNEKILVVAHGELFRIWTADWKELKRPYIDYPEENLIFENCQFYIDEEFDYINQQSNYEKMPC
jgi:broad specificity phosphatase PhoE